MPHLEIDTVVAGVDIRDRLDCQSLRERTAAADSSRGVTWRVSYGPSGFIILDAVLILVTKRREDGEG